MSKLKKRILSLILCAVLCISFLPVCACGADEGQPIAEENETDIIPEETVLQEDPAIEENDGAAEDEGPPEEENDIAEEPAENTESSTGEAPAAEEEPEVPAAANTLLETIMNFVQMILGFIKQIIEVIKL